MEITYNNQTTQNIITLTDVPNILKVEDESGGTYATLIFVIANNFKSITTSDNQWYITFLGETITNVMSPQNAVNKNFYVSNSNVSTASSMAKAFRNCPTVIANFDVEQVDFGIARGVRLTAKAVGTVWTGISDYLSTNIPSSYLSVSPQDGEAWSDLQGALIDVDVYSDGNYITTLEKSWYNGEAAFNMSPVLTTISRVGEIVPYTFRISSIKDGEYATLGNISTNYSTVGYMCNQGYKYLNNDFSIAQNFSRGTSREFENNTILYLYEPKINISLYTGNNGGFSYSIDYLDSAFNNITPTITATKRCSSNSLLDLEFALNHDGSAHFPSAFYIDLTLGSLKVRYNVIKPLKATEYGQRILWRNSYGGISFFDFTGQKSETRDVEISTYQKNIFDYYTDEMNELNKIYDNEVKYTVTLKSHLFEIDGKYIFNDLLQSPLVWTEINGETYAIIIDSVSVDETDNNNVYEATVKYHYSQEPSLI